MVSKLESLAREVERAERLYPMSQPDEVEDHPLFILDSFYVSLGNGGYMRRALPAHE